MIDRVALEILGAAPLVSDGGSVDVGSGARGGERAQGEEGGDEAGARSRAFMAGMATPWRGATRGRTA